MATAVPSPTPNPLHGLASRHDPFAVRCDGGIEFLRTDNLEVISSMPLDIKECTVAWSPDGTAIAILTPDSSLFIADTDDGQFHPAKALIPPITMTRLSAWSPDSQRLVVGQTAEGEASVGKGWGGELVALDREARELLRFSARALADDSATLWLGNTVIAVADQEGMDMYRAVDGRFLGYCVCGPNLDEGQAINQLPLLSPDGRWLALHRTFDTGVYEIVDVLRDESYSLSQPGSAGVDFLEWKKDSTAFFFISHPEGLMAFDTVTREIRSLFDLALDARFNPYQEWAFVFFPSRRTPGGQSLSAGLWQVGTNTMLGRHTISESLVSVPLYSGVEMEQMGRSGVIPVGWSIDGTRVAWMDGRLRVVTQSIRGADKVIAEGLFTDFGYWIHHGSISWLENDATILLKTVDRTQDGTEYGSSYRISSR
jgi:hypothetical protein